MLWFWLAILAAAAWGIGYLLEEKLLAAGMSVPFFVVSDLCSGSFDLCAMAFDGGKFES